jgi:hypothetical protein
LRRARAAAGLGVALGVIALGAPARAADGLYGRFDGDLELRFAAGAALTGGGPALAAQVTAVYLSTAGVYLHYTDALGGEGPRVRRSVATGLHLQPVFLARYASNVERGPARADLLLDSLAFEIGPFWAEPRGAPWATTPGLEIALGLAFPILERATGPFVGLRGAVRWRAGDFAAGAGGRDPVERGALLSLTLGWHHVVPSHLVDAGDGQVR